MNIPLQIRLPGGILLPRSALMTGDERHPSPRFKNSERPWTQKAGPGQSRPLSGGEEKKGGRRLKRLCLGIILVFIWLFGIPLAFLQSYSKTSSNTMIGLVCVAPTHKPDTMSLELILYDDHERLTYDNQYVLPGNQWRIQGKIIIPLVNVLGLSPAYELTDLQSGDQGSSQVSKNIDLSNGNDNFFQVVKAFRPTSPLLYAFDGSSDFWSAGKRLTVYDVFLSPNGFSVEQAPAEAAKSCSLHNSALPAP